MAREKRNCQYCGKDFIVPPNNPGRKYCDMDCYRHDIKKNGKPSHKKEQGEDRYTLIKCQGCGEEFQIEKWKVRRGLGKYCTRECSGKHNMGELNQTHIAWNKGMKGRYFLKATKDNNLQVVEPELAKQFFVERNGMSPLEVKSKSTKKYWWKCEYGDDHIWQDSPNYRCKSPECPFCAHKKPSKDYNLAAVYPKLAAQWHDEKNALKPEEVMPKTERSVWWKCNVADDHVWEAKIHSRAVRYTDESTLCPFCIGSRVCESNCLATTHPELLAQWDYSKNKVSPHEVYYGVHSKFWWTCHKGHAWLARPNSRLSDFKKCPVCSMPRGEAKISELLDSYGVNYKREYTHPELRARRFDFAVFLDELRLIEYQGLQHYEPVDFYGARKDPEKDFRGIKKRDQEKKDFVKKKKIPFLEIPYFKFDEIEIKVKEFVQK
tara:strand:- start:1253 stop:2554 length:1302 start_codon:yes stop_codon:yes gene_type:complete